MVDSSTVKEQLGVRAKSIIAQGLGLREDKKKVSCPYHEDKKPSMSWFDQGMMWRCHSCQAQVDIYEYLTKHEKLEFKDAVKKVAEMVGYAEPVRAKKTSYTKPNIKTRELQQPFIDYMAKRKIEKETLDYWRVKQTKWGKREVYVFQYYDQNNQLEYVSYRGLGKEGLKGGAEKNTKPILWGMWHIDKTKPVVVTEGQIDAMAVWQSGYNNVVSVPNGSNNFKWKDTCWDWLQGVVEVIVFADNDEPGIKMANEIKRSLKNVKIAYSEKHKDANEVLYYDGPEAVIEIVENSIKQLIPGVIDLAEKEYIVNVGNNNENIETGFYEYDYHVEDWKPGELTVIFGRNNEGKTTFVSQIIAHNLHQNKKILLYSGEMSDEKIQNWLYRQIIGSNKDHLTSVTGKYKEKLIPKVEVLKKIKEWHKGNLYLVDRAEKETMADMDKFFNMMELMARRQGVKLFVIDNLMSALQENAESLFSDQANFTQRCKDFAINNQVHVVLLAHPNKEKTELKEAEQGNLDKRDISGSNNIANKADNIIAVERNWQEGGTDAIITSLKDRESGQRLTLLFFFSKQSLRFYNSITREHVDYGWDVDDETPPWERDDFNASQLGINDQG